MKPAALWHFYRIRLRSRLGSELLALLGLAVGVALVFSALVANASLTGAVRELTAGMVGRADFQLAARSAAGMDQRVLDRVDDLPGVAAAPIAEGRVNLVGPGGRTAILLIGGDARSRAVGGALLRHVKDPARGEKPGVLLPSPVAAELAVEAGDRVRVETGTGVAAVRVSGVLGEAQVGALAESPVAVAPLPLVQGLLGMRGRLSRIFVDAGRERASRTAERLRRIAGERLNVGPADEEAASFEKASYPTTRSTGLFSVLSALVGFLFALNSVLLSVPQRRRLFADLELAGYAPLTVARIAVVDGLVLGVAGSAVGLLVGEIALGLLLGPVPDYLASAFAIGSQRVVTPQSVLLAGAAGILAACLAALVPLAGCLRVDPPARSLASGPRWQGPVFVAGMVLLCGAVATAALAPMRSLTAIVALLISMILVLGAWLRFAATLGAAPLRRCRSASAMLAALEVRAGSGGARTLTLAATGAVAAFATLAITGAKADLQKGLDRVSEDVDRGAAVWIAFRGPTNIFGVTPISIDPRQRREIERLPGVRSMRGNRGSFLDIGENRVWVRAPARGVGDGRVRLSRELAADLHVGEGDSAKLPLPHPVELRVAGITDNFGWPGGALLLSPSDYARAWGSSAFSSFGLRLAHGASPASAAASVRAILGPRSPLLVETSEERMRRQQATSRAGLSRLDQIAALVLISSALAMAATMAGMVWQRRPLFAALKLHGMEEAELWRALLYETALVLGAGCLAGAAFGLIGQAILDQALRSITGFPVIYTLPWERALAISSLLGLTAIAMLALPGWLVVRVPPQAGLVD